MTFIGNKEKSIFSLYPSYKTGKKKITKIKSCVKYVRGWGKYREWHMGKRKRLPIKKKMG